MGEMYTKGCITSADEDAINNSEYISSNIGTPGHIAFIENGRIVTDRTDIRQLVVDDEGTPKYEYIDNLNYDPSDISVTVNISNVVDKSITLRSEFGRSYLDPLIEVITSEEYPLLKQSEKYAPNYWDRLYEQTILGKEYVWYRLNPV